MGGGLGKDFLFKSMIYRGVFIFFFIGCRRFVYVFWNSGFIL